MAFIRQQNVKKDENGNIVTGSASIIDVTYTGTKEGKRGHSQQKVRESLGRILWMAEDGRSGIFQSAVRGLVSYDVGRDTFEYVDPEDSRLGGLGLMNEPDVHTVFGDAYLMTQILKNSGLESILETVFEKETDIQRCAAHIFYCVMRNGGRHRCDLFVAKSYMSYIIPKVSIQSLRCDSSYFSLMGSDGVRMRFFKGFVDMMRKKEPDFGRCCYVDSTPLPNDISNNPFNALCSHGLRGCDVQMRLVLILDKTTGYPVWYSIVPGNVLDLSTLKDVIEDASTSLGITVDDMVLDAGYVSKQLIQAISVVKPDEDDLKECDDHVDIPAAEESDERFNKTFLARMPAKRGYPYKTLYHSTRKLYGNAKYDFCRNDHTYFGHRKLVKIFDRYEYAYVYVDYENALNGYKGYMKTNEEEFLGLNDKDKTWKKVAFGYFVLISNRKASPSEILDEYFGRTSIEGFFKTQKEYLHSLPIAKWTDETVRGKILNDMICTIAYLWIRKTLAGKSISVPEIITSSQSLMCRKVGDTVYVEPPNKQVKAAYSEFGLKVPTSISLKS